MCCFTCGKPIAHIYPEYLKTLKTIRSQTQTQIQATAEKEKNTLGSATVPTLSPEFQALAQHGIWRDCDRRMFLGQQDLYTEIS
jgi:DNA-directed RNA polymerase subunit N (RpoN/RPB10)